LNVAIRSRLQAAVAALCDRELQERLWVRGERHNAEELTFDDAVLFIIDELATSNPAELVGHVLLDETELEAFLRLSKALEALVDAIGDHGTFADARNSGRVWQECVDAATDLKRRLGG